MKDETKYYSIGWTPHGVYGWLYAISDDCDNHYTFIGSDEIEWEN